MGHSSSSDGTDGRRPDPVRPATSTIEGQASDVDAGRSADQSMGRGRRGSPERADFGGQTSITITQYHAVGADPVNPATGAKGAPTPDYTEFETFTLVRPRSS